MTAMKFEEPIKIHVKEEIIENRSILGEDPLFETNSSVKIQTNQPREIPIQRGPTMTENSRVHGDWRGPWPTDNMGPKPRLVGGKLITPKLIASHSAGQPTH